MRYDLRLSRRVFLDGAGLGLLGCASGTPVSRTPSIRKSSADLDARFAELERSVGGRLGVAALDTSPGKGVSYRADERFPMCSTFKLPLVAAVLQRVDAGQEQLDRHVSYEQAAVLEYAPTTSRHVGDGMSVEQLCEASLVVSDNTAANLLLETLGGPAGLTKFFRSVGDATSRLDRNEPMLNTAFDGDERDTTTPGAMLASMNELLLGTALSAASRERLQGWLVANKTGDKRLRAGLPPNFRVGDKTGTGENGATNDVAIAWPDAKPPLLIAAYSVGSSASTERLSEMLANAARLIVAATLG
jgi:beta-lactamase class A